jgi:hypothetical protein
MRATRGFLTNAFKESYTADGLKIDLQEFGFKSSKGGVISWYNYLKQE